MIARMFAAALAAVLAAALVAGCTRSEQRQAPPEKAPEFTLKDLSGKDVKLADQRGKVVLVEFWATWCPPCIESIPAMERLHRAYADKGLVVLAISLDEGGRDMVSAFARENGISYTVLEGSEDVTMNYMVRVVPSMFLVGRDGMIAKRYVGGDREESLEKDIRSLL